MEVAILLASVGLGTCSSLAAGHPVTYFSDCTFAMGLGDPGQDLLASSCPIAGVLS